jgi:SAM-dependent methyltransferase
VVNGIAWSCPHCRGRIGADGECWHCVDCGSRFRTLRGIPDLRTRDDLYLSNAEDWSFALALDAEFDRRDSRGLLERYFDLAPEIAPDLRRRQLAHILSAPGRCGRWLDAIGGCGTGPLLDLGCGTGSFLAAVGPELAAACGVDIAMRWLLVARKRLDECGLEQVPLACACAEDLPLAPACVTAIVAGDVIEHVADQAKTLAEAHRVLQSCGRIFLASPNRYSLAPEPHVQVWGVGYLPRRWMGRYVRLRRGIDFRAVRTLGSGEWRRLLDSSPFRGGQITVPPLPPDDLAEFGPIKSGIARLYNAAVTTRTGQALARAVGPLFHVVCEKFDAATPRSSILATHRRSKSGAGRA